jgi:hypothetical protein
MSRKNEAQGRGRSVLPLNPVTDFYSNQWVTIKYGGFFNKLGQFAKPIAPAKSEANYCRQLVSAIAITAAT